MPKAYWVICHRSTRSPEKFAAFTKLSYPAIRAAGGQFLAKLVGEVVTYENMYRLCYIRGPEGILIALAQQLGQQTSRENPFGRER